MAVKEAKDLELLPRMSANEKRIFNALTNHGLSTIAEIAENGGLTKGRIPAALEKMIQRGLILELKTDDSENPRYAAIYPITRFIKIVDKLTNSLEIRKEELQGYNRRLNEFTENAIKNVREASTEERQKRNARSEEDIKDLEMAMDASFSGILASVEMDLKDLGKIAQTSNEFLVESSIRTEETGFNIRRTLDPLKRNFLKKLITSQYNVEDQLEATVDSRVSNVLDFETNANKAFIEVIDAFKDSQDAFEEIIFSVLDSGIEDLEKVTRPINDQIEEAIKSLKMAIGDASNNFQQEILRVLTEQKRPMVSAVEGLRSKTKKVLTNSLSSQNEILDEQYQALSVIMENHTSIFSEAIEQLAREFDRKVSNLVEKTQVNLVSVKDDIQANEVYYKDRINAKTEEKNNLIHITSNKTRDIINEMMDQFVIVLNRSVAQYQIDLSDLVAHLENDFLNTVDKHGSGIRNLVSYINMSLTEPVTTLMKNLSQLNEKIQKDEEDFLLNFEKTLTKDLLAISNDFQKDTKKSEDELEKDVKRLTKRFDKEIDNNHNLLTNRLKSSQKNLQSIFKNFSDLHDKELQTTRKEVNNLTNRLERWRGESVNALTHRVNDNVNKSMQVLSDEINQIIAKIESNESTSNDEVIKVVRESYHDISKSFKGFGNVIGDLVRQSLDDIANTLKKDSLSIKNRLVQFKKEQDKLVNETKRPSIKLIDDISDDYLDLYKKLTKNLERFFDSELDVFKRSRRDIGKALENTLNRRSSRSSKEITSLKNVFENARENYVKKTQNSFEDIVKTISRDSRDLLDQESTSRNSITNLVEKVVGDVANGANATVESLRINLGEGSKTIFGQASAEINKQEIELNTLNDDMRDETLSSILELSDRVKEQIQIIETRTTALQDRQIGDVYEFKNKFTINLEEDLNGKLDELQRSQDELRAVSDKLAQLIQEAVDTETYSTVQELEAKASGIEGAIFSTVGNITAEAGRRTDSVVVIGEQAVLGIEERYTENLEKIRQSLTDEVIGRIEKEAQRIEKYKDTIREIGRNHRVVYGDATSNLNEKLKLDLKETEKAAMKIFDACENISNKFLVNLDSEISAMGDRVGLSTERLTVEILNDIDRVFQKVKREVGLFARKQFELSNRSNQEIAEAFLKSVDDLEEVIIKQFESFAKQANRSMNHTKEVSEVVSDHIKDITETFNELSQ